MPMSRGYATALLLGLALVAAPAAAERPQILGFVRVAGGVVDSAPSFLEGGFGKTLAGALPGDVVDENAGGELRLAIDWELGVGWRLFAHGVARTDPVERGGTSGSGLLEAYVEGRRGFGAGHEIVARLGQFFLPASRENVGPLWTSPYTLTLSAMNSWIAEEIRPIGLDLAWRHTAPSERRLELAATVFGGNDTSGTLLAWRGFSFHDRPTPTGAFVPLPPRSSFVDTFTDQDRRGTLPFGADLDGRPGWAGRARWNAPRRRAVVQTTIFFNDGDRRLHGGQYSWRTDFRWLSTEVALPAGLRLLGEWGTGFSEMGLAPAGAASRSVVDVEYETFYLLLTRAFGPLRASLRYDDFFVEDRDGTAGDDNREDGRAWTFALLASLGESWRLGAEYLSVEADNAAARAAGSPDPGGRSFRLELRYSF